MAIGRFKRRRPIPPGDLGEVISLATTSGGSLAVEIREPRGTAAGTVVLLHSMMASRRIWNSPREQGLASALNEAGLRTLSLDFRGHGDSGPSASKGGKWSYDDLVREDVPAICQAARERWPKDRLTLIGHSLGGHVSLASVSTSLAEPDALVVLATNIWLRSEEPNPLLYARKAAMVRFCEVATRARGFFPARTLGFGSDDEAAPLMEGWTGWWNRNSWTSDDQRVDYLSTLARIRIPILSIASSGDRYLCTASNAARFIKRTPSANTTFEVVRRSDDGSTSPDHMQLVTTRAAASSWPRIAAFCKNAR
jgi:predicted alpha/beta hydrolase